MSEICDWCEADEVELHRDGEDLLCKVCFKHFDLEWEDKTSPTFATRVSELDGWLESVSKKTVGVQPKVRSCQHRMTPFKVGNHTVYLSAHRDRDSNRKAGSVAGVYLDHCWIQGQVFASDRATTSSSRTMYIAWPDMNVVPIPTLVQGIRWINHKLEGGEKVEIGCIGGHGRTGTMAAALLINQGMSAKKAIKKVRKTYCGKAIETKAQETMLKEYAQWLTSR